MEDKPVTLKFTISCILCKHEFPPLLDDEIIKAIQDHKKVCPKLSLKLV